MQHNDFQLVNQVIDWLAQQHRVALCTVISTWGSSPRPAGSLFAMCETGDYIGSVSGGCVEEDLLECFLAGQFTDIHIRRYDGSNQQRPLMLPCNSQLDILIEPQLSLSQFKTILQKLKQSQSISRRTCLNTQEASLHTKQFNNFFAFESNTLSRVFGMTKNMILIGQGDIAQHLSQIAYINDYQVAICDPRSGYATSTETHHATSSTQMPDDFIHSQNITSNSVIITLSHDPKLDDMALIASLNSPAFYVGALGSKRSAQLRQQRLLAMHLDQHDIDRLHAPVGLDIGSHTPAEIAISIMAEVIALSHQHNK